MSTTTTATSRSAYTLIATGPRRVVVDYTAVGRVRLAISASLPSPSSIAWFAAAPDSGGRVVTVGAGLNLYAMTDPSAASDITVAVSPYEDMLGSSVEISNDAGNAIPVSGPLTDTQLRAAAVPVTATALTSIDADIGAPADAAWGGTGDASVIAALKAIALATAGATPSGANLIGHVGRRIVTASAGFSRPANTTTYASGQLLANSTTAGSVVPLTLTAARVATASFGIGRLRLRKSGTGTANASFRVHLFAVSPTVTNGDGGVFLPNQAANYLGAWDVATNQAFSDGAVGTGSPLTGTVVNGEAVVPVKLASGTDIFALIEARAAYAPVSGETFTVSIDVIQD